MSIKHAIVVAVTTRNRELPHHVALARDSGLPRASWAMGETMRAVSTARFEGFVGWASPEVMGRLAGWIEYFTIP
jgi:mRNA-degrading endonuclease toxin of MazEF toxin-antitoxin module